MNELFKMCDWVPQQNEQDTQLNICYVVIMTTTYSIKAALIHTYTKTVSYIYDQFVYASC